MNLQKLLLFLFAGLAVQALNSQDMPLSQVLIPGERWQLVAKDLGFTDAPTGQPAHAECKVNGNIASGNDADLHLACVTQSHKGAFAKLLVDAGNS